MGKYLDSRGLITLWNKLKAYIQSAIPTNVSSFTNDSKYVIDSGDTYTSIITGYGAEDSIFATTTGAGNGMIGVNPGGVDIVSNWSGSGTGSNNSGTKNVYIRTGAGVAYYNGEEIATKTFVTNTTATHTCWANSLTSQTPNYITQPEFKSVKINGSTTNSASSNNCVLEYDTTNKCLKFVFN